MAVAISVLALSVSPCLEAKELEDKKWLEVKTANFQIRSMMSERKTLKVARNLEAFRVVAAMITNAGLTDSAVPVEIFAISGGKAIKSFNLEDFGGHFYGQLRRNTIVVKEQSGDETLETMLHEYVHFLMRNYATNNFPMWFEEGFAEYLSSARLRSEEVFIGGVHKWMARILWRNDQKRISLEKVISRRSEDDWPIEQNGFFYSASWAIVHYLQNRPDQEQSFDEQLKIHVDLLETGVDAVDAFEIAFGLSIPGLGQELQKYLAGKRVPGFAIPVRELIPDFEAEVSRMSREQISLSLGNYALNQGEPDKAKHWFEIAAEDDQLLARAESGLGTLRMNDGEFDRAKSHFDKAAELAPDDPLCHLDIAAYWFTLASEESSGDRRPEYLAYARQHQIRAWELDKTAPEAYAMYGATFIAEGRHYDRAIDMLEQAKRLLGSSVDIRLLLAEAYLRSGDTENATKYAGSVLAWSHSEWDGSIRAREILAEANPATRLENLEVEETL